MKGLSNQEVHILDDIKVEKYRAYFNTECDKIQNFFILSRVVSVGIHRADFKIWGSDEMNDLEQRVKTLKIKVKMLEETLETLKNMSLSEQMDSFIQSRQKSLRMVELLNTVSDDGKLDFDKERASLDNVRIAKQNIDAQIAQAVMNTGTFSEDFPDDPRNFTYEIESEVITNCWHQNEKVKSNASTSLVGKGFETERIVVPKEIEGLPVLNIGAKAFINAPCSEIILPKTVKVLLWGAFSGCVNLKHIDLPEDLTFVDRECFANSGLEEITLPNSLKEISYRCFYGCKNLSKVIFGSNVTKIDYSAFHECSKLKDISLPESLEEIGFHAFAGTAISILIIPQGVKTISHRLFAFCYTRSNRQITCVFLGTETEVTIKEDEPFYEVAMIYCLPGSAVQKYARERKIPIKPISEFRMEDYQ